MPLRKKLRRHNVNLWAIQNWLASIWSHRKLDWRMDGSLDQILKRSGREKRTFRSGQCSEIANRDTSVMKVPPTLKCSSDCALLTCTWQDIAKRGTGSCKNCKGVHRVSRPNSITHLTQTPIYEWCVVRSGSKIYSRFNNQHNLKGTISSFYNVTMSKIFKRAPNILKKMASHHSCTNSVIHILGEVGYLKERKRGAI